jgi:choline kinase
VIGMVLAAGAGRRLQPWTDSVPKTLVPVDGDRTILDVSLANFARVGLTDVIVVVGYKAEAVRERQAELEERHGVSLELVFNDKAEEWNNAYSLWCAREHFSRGIVMVNGDTIAPASVAQALLDAAGRGDDLVIALDDVHELAEEEMKVQLSDERLLTRITKLMDPAAAVGEYIGLTLIEPHVAEGLADALKTTFERDPQLYYEDGFQELAERGGRVGVASIGDVEWVEVDDHADLAQAREVACRC